MPSTPEDIDSILTRAAKNSCMKNNGSWLFLETFLDGAGVDISQRSESEWMKPFQIYRQLIEDTKTEESRSVKGGNSPPDTASFADSAIHLDDKSDQVDHIFIMVRETLDCPDGRESALIIWSETEEESYILKTICEMCGLLPGPDGKVNVKYYRKGSKKSATEKCRIRLDNDGEADLVFARKPTKEEPEGISDQPSIRRHPNSSPRDSLNDLAEEDEGVDDIDVATSSALAIGQALKPPRAHALSDAETEQLGRRIEIATQAATRERINRKGV